MLEVMIKHPQLAQAASTGGETIFISELPATRVNNYCYKKYKRETDNRLVGVVPSEQTPTQVRGPRKP